MIREITIEPTLKEWNDLIDLTNKQNDLKGRNGVRVSIGPQGTTLVGSSSVSGSSEESVNLMMLGVTADSAISGTWKNSFGAVLGNLSHGISSFVNNEGRVGAQLGDRLKWKDIQLSAGTYVFKVGFFGRRTTGNMHWTIGDDTVIIDTFRDFPQGNDQAYSQNNSAFSVADGFHDLEMVVGSKNPAATDFECLIAFWQLEKMVATTPERIG